MSLVEINEEKLDLVEKFIQENRHFLSEIKCCYKPDYKPNGFKFLPGYRASILGIPTQVVRLRESKKTKKNGNQSETTKV